MLFRSGARLNGRFSRSLHDSLTPWLSERGLPVRVRYRNASASGCFELAEAWRVSPSDELITALRDVEGHESVALRYRGG